MLMLVPSPRVDLRETVAVGWTNVAKVRPIAFTGSVNWLRNVVPRLQIT